MHKSRNCELWFRSVSRWLGLQGVLPSPATADSFLQAGWRPDLVLQMPCELYQPELAELPVSLRQPQDLLPPSCSPLLGDDNPSGSIKHYFLTGLSMASQEQLQHLISPGRLAFGSLTSMPWFACARHKLKNCRPACSRLSLLLPAPARRLRLPLSLMPEYSPLLVGGTG